MNFVARLFDNGAAADKSALLYRHGEISYRQLQRQVQTSAALLQQQGVEAEDRVLLIAEPSLFWVESYLATIWSGAASIPLPPALEIEQLQQIIQQTNPVAVFIQSNLLRRYATALSATPLLICDQAPKRKPDREIILRDEIQPMDCPAYPASSEALAAIIFTSGSTATPLGVRISHQNLLSNTSAIIQALKIESDDRMMSVLPLHYCFGASLLHTHLQAGASLVIDNRFLFPDKVLDRIDETGCSSFAGVPSTFQILLHHSNLANKPLPTLTRLQQAGGHLAQSDIDRLEALLPHSQLYVMYGQTEATARLSIISPEQRKHHPGSIGRGLNNLRLQVLNPDGQPVAVGEVGEIVASGPSISQGYWDSSQNQQSFRNGKLYTGDLATVDAQGYIHIAGRTKDFLKCAGKRASCQQLESKLADFPGLQAAAVIGVPDPVLGEAVCLFASHPQGDNIREQLLQFCEQQFERHLVPQQIHLLQQLPLNSSGKYDKLQLRQMLKEMPTEHLDG